MRAKILSAVVVLSISSASAAEASQGQAARAEGKSVAVENGNNRRAASREETALLRQEEKVIRDAYARLMRYHTAFVDEMAMREGKATSPQDYITFEIRGVRGGPIEELLDSELSEVASFGQGDIIVAKRHHLRWGDGPEHVYYEVAWAKSGAAGMAAEDGARDLQEALEVKGFRRYVSYEVVVRLSGKEKRYRALGLRREGDRADGKPNMEIKDFVVRGMNEVMADERPRVRSPWDRYVRSGLYLAVVREIRRKERRGEPLIPADAPIGYLPGDEAISGGDNGLLVVAGVCGSCGDERDQIIQEYRDYRVGFIPSCGDFTRSASSAHFSFAELNTGDYSWAIIRQSLLSGLECVRSANGGVPLRITSAYRNPARNARVDGAQDSRHMYGDAADIASYNDRETWERLRNAGKSCGACVEPWWKSTFSHVHVDWRGGCPPKW